MTTTMKIAAPVKADGTIDGHFGHCDSYNVFSVSENKEILKVETVKSPQGCGCKSNIAQVLASQGVTIMIAGGIGQGAINVLGAAGIKVIRGCSGNSSELVTQFIEGKLVDSGESCQHHEHGHTCEH